MRVSEDGKAISYTADDKEKALRVSLTSLASHLGFHPKRNGAHYSLEEMDSLIIYHDKTWNRWSNKGSITGGTQIDFLMAFGDVSSVPEAIKYLMEFNGESIITSTENFNQENQRSTERRAFELPPKNDNYRRLFAYLIQTRGLSQEVVSYFVQQKLIYEEAVHHNIVYCGMDPEGTIRYAGLRGTADIYGKKFKMDVPGNDKNYGVNIVNRNSNTLKVFESVIDCMSYIEMYKDMESNKLILGMVADNPLEQFLKDYDHITDICFCLDADEAGRKAVYGEFKEDGNYKPGLKDKYLSRGYNVSEEFPDAGKDFNESLLHMKKNCPFHESRPIAQEAPRFRRSGR